MEITVSTSWGLGKEEVRGNTFKMSVQSGSLDFTKRLVLRCVQHVGFCSISTWGARADRSPLRSGLSQTCHLLKPCPPRYPLLLTCHLGSTRSLRPVIPSTAPSHLFPIFHFANIYGACATLPALFWAIGIEQETKQTKNPVIWGFVHWKDLITNVKHREHQKMPTLT